MSGARLLAWMIAGAGCGHIGFDPSVDGARGVDVAQLDDRVTSGARVTAGLVALYTFDEGTGSTAFDVSGVTPALDLQIGTGTSWVQGGLQIGAGAAATASATGTAGIATACMTSSEETIEAWIQSASAATQPAERIFGLAGNNNLSEASLGQENTGYYGQIRTSTASTKLATPIATATTSLVHLVHTRAANGDRVVYMDGVMKASTAGSGDFSNWDSTLPVTVGNALDGGVLWQGTIYLAAIYCRALSAPEVAQNTAAGP